MTTNEEWIKIVHILSTELAQAPEQRIISEKEYQRLVSIRADEDANPGDAQYAPAKTAALSEEEVGELWDHVAPMDFPWAALNQEERQTFDSGMQALLAKHGGARELPGRDEVIGALRNSWVDWTCGDVPTSPGDAPRDAELSLRLHADAVMALYGGGGDE